MKVKSSIVLDKRTKTTAMAMIKDRGLTFSGLVGVLLSRWIRDNAQAAARGKLSKV